MSKRICLKLDEESMEILRSEGSQDFIQCCIRLFMDGFLDVEKLESPYNTRWLPERIRKGDEKLYLRLPDNQHEFIETFKGVKSNIFRKMMNIYLQQKVINSK